MKKAVFLASLAVMTASVWGMNNVNSSNTADVSEARRAVRFNSDMVNVTEPEEIIRDIVNSNDAMVIRNFFGKLLYIHDQIFVRNQSLEKFGMYEEIEFNEMMSAGMMYEESESDEENPDDRSFAGMMGEETESYGMTPAENILEKNGVLTEKLTFECLLSCLSDIRSKIIYLLMYENKTSVNSNKFRENAEVEVQNFLEHAIKRDSLHFMAKNSKINSLNIMLHYGADVNKENKKGETPLFSACESGNLNLVKYLIEHGANINKENFFRSTPLFEACKSKNESLVKYLIDAGADINKKDQNGETPLFDVCRSGNVNLVKYLVEHGADVNRAENFRETPLHIACNLDNESLVKYLVEHGADVNKMDLLRETPVFYACESENESLVKYLVEHGADVNKKNSYGETPLFKACESGNLNLVKYLVEEHGADVNKKIAMGKTPLSIARFYGYNYLERYLMDHGATYGERSE